MSVYRQLLLLLFGCLVCLVCLGSQAQNISFKHLSSREGLSQSPVFTTVQDSKGLIWIGNREGLLRFDGYDFKRYFNKKVRRQNAIHNDIRAIVEDAQGQLWLGTSSGVVIFNPTTEQFTAVSTTDLPIVYAMLMQVKTLWAATSEGLRKIDMQTRRQTAVKLAGNIPNATQNKRVLALYPDRQGFIWAGTDHGVICFDPSGERVRPLPTAPTARCSIVQRSRVYH